MPQQHATAAERDREALISNMRSRLQQQQQSKLEQLEQQTAADLAETTRLRAELARLSAGRPARVEAIRARVAKKGYRPEELAAWELVYEYLAAQPAGPPSPELLEAIAAGLVPNPGGDLGVRGGAGLASV